MTSLSVQGQSVPLSVQVFKNRFISYDLTHGRDKETISTSVREYINKSFSVEGVSFPLPSSALQRKVAEFMIRQNLLLNPDIETESNSLLTTDLLNHSNQTLLPM
ncbi:hypothetical protein DID80_02425 [Candidatus Marinamargulisbacteria bacterium SCGC AAA071-K20]|nr:hypothetical protein DID80_02425 [Candidatus Marinamargulisbacteria bacterium SCGC AAA071-K20]